MKEVKKFDTEVAGKTLSVEIGKLANQAHGSCTVRYGDTVVLATAVIAPNLRDGVDYFPLMVDYEERLYAAGKIKGSRFIKREGKATDEAVLSARMIDRSIRPLFKDTIRKDVQVVVTVLSVDGANDPDLPAMLAASIALGISPIPWSGPIGGVRVGRIGGELVLNPSYEAREKSDFDLVMTGTSDEIVMMEAAGKQVPEKDFYEAMVFGQKHVRRVAEFIKDVVAKSGVAKSADPVLSPEDQAIESKVSDKVRAFLKQQGMASVFSADKSKMKANIEKLTDDLNAMLKADNEVSKDARARGLALLDEALSEAARDLVLQTQRRVDGRGLNELRSLSAEVGILPRTHGTGLFSRGETQVLSIVTLGSPGDEQTLDTMEESGKKRYMHHYNFPGFSVGEVRPMRFPSRREVGHGALAEKAIIPLLPSKEDFPYTIRVVSEVLSSNGSSSQASACGSSLALMDAGVPLSAACAGVAMGLITDPKDKKNYHVLTDIQGIEDHSGDMDFKVAGTATGITAIQLDIKLGGISLEIVETTLNQAREARLKILDTMVKAIAAPRPELSEYAPRITTLRIPVEKIREVIGSGGKIINEIIDTCDVAIDIEDDGLVMITAPKAENGAKAKAWIEDIVREIEVGQVFEGPVTDIVTDRNTGSEIGAIVSLGRSKDGMVHISQLRYEHVEKISDFVKVGDTLKVKVMEVDKERGRISLSAKALLPMPENFTEEHRGFRPQRPRGGNDNRHSRPRRGRF